MPPERHRPHLVDEVRERRQAIASERDPGQPMRDERNARLARCAEQRAGTALAFSRSVAGYLDLIVGASLLVPLAGAVVIFGLGMLTGKEPYDPTIWAALALLIGGGAVLRLFRQRRRRRQRWLESGLSAVASRWRDGSCLRTQAERLAWMGRYWAAGHRSDDLWTGPVHRAVAGKIRDYPVLIDVEPDGCAGEDVTIEPHIVVYLAAVAPQDTPGSDLDQGSRQLAAAGFQLELEPEAGLVARATLPTIKQMRRRLGSLDVLTSVVETMIIAARAIGASPAPAGPDRR